MLPSDTEFPTGCYIRKLSDYHLVQKKILNFKYFVNSMFNLISVSSLNVPGVETINTAKSIIGYILQLNKLNKLEIFIYLFIYIILFILIFIFLPL